MSKNKKSVVSRLFFTFGTVFLVSIIAVCTINFARDGRVFQAPLLSAANGVTGGQGTAGTENKTDDYKTIKYNKPSSTDKSTEVQEPATSGTGVQQASTAEP